ncbi:MAG: DUF4097 family beta strand repeat protein [Gammaproteobacteria bacterium]|nr:DUF4097 family beta strand repeat protein [Gammaproteobacteria bacterium]
MMKKLMVLMATALLAMPALAEDIDRTLDAAADGEVKISTVSGSVTVNGWSRNEVKVTGTLGPKVEELIFERDGDNITIKVKVPKKSGRGSDSDLRVNVPEKSSIDVGVISADIQVSDVLGEQRLHTVSGNVTTESTGSDVKAQSVSGDVEIVGNKAEARTVAGTVSGDVTVVRAAGDVRAETVTGKVVVDEGSFDHVALNTVNGEVLFQAQLRDDGKFSAETINGEIDAEFTGGISARIDVSTINGRIKNCFGPEARRTNEYGPGWDLSFTEGDGGGRVRISTMNGRVNLCRK